MKTIFMCILILFVINIANAQPNNNGEVIGGGKTNACCDSLNLRLDAVQREMQELNTQLFVTQAQQGTVLTHLQLLSNGLSTMASRVSNIENKIRNIESNIVSLQSNTTVLNSKVTLLDSRLTLNESNLATIDERTLQHQEDVDRFNQLYLLLSTWCQTY